MTIFGHSTNPYPASKANNKQFGQPPKNVVFPHFGGAIIKYFSRSGENAIVCGLTGNNSFASSSVIPPPVNLAGCTTSVSTSTTRFVLIFIMFFFAKALIAPTVLLISFLQTRYLFAFFVAQLLQSTLLYSL